jgi:3-hydroxybutyryl-CoA dehydrogenase
VRRFTRDRRGQAGSGQLGVEPLGTSHSQARAALIEEVRREREPVQTVVIVGTGRMAPGIAAACAVAGSTVTIAGRSRRRAEAAAEAATLLAGRDVHGAPLAEVSFAGAELAIETVVEDLAVKHEVLATIERGLSADAVVATNTSSLPIDELAEGLSRPERFAGLHFLNPAQLTAVVEVVPGRATSPATVQLLAELVGRMGKRPLVLLRDVPGFIWNRIQFAVLRECLHILDEQVADASAIDAAVSDGVAPRWLAAGPLATVDLGGIETFRRAAENLFPLLASDAAVPASLSGRAAADEAFYRWTPESTAAIEELRAKALDAGRRIADRRTAEAPDPNY